LWTYRTLAWSVLIVPLVCGATLLTLRYWVLPNIESYREDVARAVSKAAHQRVTIGRMSGSWEGLRPQLALEDVTVYDKAARPALGLKRVDATVSWRSLLLLQVSFHALDIHGPALDVRRHKDGSISVAGVEVEQQDRDGGGFTDWLLAQPDVEVHDGSLSWTDELRGAPSLQLQHVNLQIVNRGKRHRFGLAAVPPVEVAGPIDLRGDMTGRTLAAPAEWDGKLFLQLDSVDIAAWRTWVGFPIEVPRGTGALRTWLTFNHDALTEIIADVQLAGVQTRLRKDLPELAMDRLSGRLAWKRLPAGYLFSSSRLTFAGPAGAAVMQPTDFMLRRTTERDGTQRSEMQANALELAPLVMLADHLPLDDEMRKNLVAIAPRGALYDVTTRWTGEWPQPAQYSARARFDDLSMNRYGTIPAFSHLSGTIEGTDKGGVVNLKTSETTLDLPAVFPAPLVFELAGQLNWSRARGSTEFRFANLAFANTDVAGAVQGMYRTAAEGRGEIDITGHLTRADASKVARYFPMDVAKGARPWLERAFVAGASNDVRVRVRGRLEDFPFADDRNGVFDVTARISGGTLDYAEGWPQIREIEGDVHFRGRRMTVAARHGTIFGVKLANVRAEIPQMGTRAEIVTVTGEAEGPTSDFLDFVAKSPVHGMIDRFNEGVQAQGRGKLSLKLALPLHALNTTRVNGTYQAVSNVLTSTSGLPPLEQVNGRLEFTESAVRVPAANAVFLGGPVTIAAATQRDGSVRATVQGKINADNARRPGMPALMQNLRGSTDWRGAFTFRRRLTELVLESNLQGVASDLPAPFSKTAAEAVAVRFERRSGAQQDRVSLAYGDLVSAQLAVRSGADGKTVIERGVVRFGGPAGEPDKPGLWLTGALKTLDLDEWLRRIGDNSGEVTYSLGGMDVKVGAVDVFDRRFHDLAIIAAGQPGTVQWTLAGREVDGTGTWRSQGKGRLTARFKKLVLPAATARAGTPDRSAPAGKSPELPALDVVAENFQFGQKQLGQLELTAVPEDRDWRIERLRLTNPESVTTVDGLWQGWLNQPRTQVNVRMEVSDIGKALTRWGYPEGVRRGTAKIEGMLSWAGSPQGFDFPTLTGNLVVDAANGQFLKLDPGIAKLLGILSLQSLPRRISLDFRDIFSEGFAFDAIIGSLKINRGLATTENFRLQGPSARVAMNGEVDLARETANLTVRVSPQISDTLSIAGALIGGPVAGVAAFLAQKILKDPLNQLASFDYAITGPWSDPVVAKVVHRQQASEAP
jgi:uncharacterized protein (TIGR02099 family)